MEREARQMPKAKLRAASRVQNEPDVPPARPPQPLDIRQGGFEPAGVLGTPQWIPSKQITQAALMSSSGESSKPAIGSSSPSLGLQSLLSQSTVTTPGTFNRSQRPLGISSTRSFGPAALSSSILTQQSTSSLPTVSRFAQRPADTTPHATKHPTNTTIPREATPASNPTKLFKLFVHPSQLLRQTLHLVRAALPPTPPAAQLQHLMGRSLEEHARFAEGRAARGEGDTSTVLTLVGTAGAQALSAKAVM